MSDKSEYLGRALIEAATHGHLDVVKQLIDCGANVHLDNEKALRRAVAKGHTEVAEFLFRKHRISVGVALIGAASDGNELEIIKLMEFAPGFSVVINLKKAIIKAAQTQSPSPHMPQGSTTTPKCDPWYL